jgi:hypothetical protein
VRVIARVTRLGLEVGSDSAVEEARARFAADCSLHIKGFLAPDLVADLQRRLASASFVRRVHDQVEEGEAPVDMVMADDGLKGRIHFLLNDPALFAFVRRLTGCDAIGCFIATVFRMMASQGQFDSWHSDVDGNRLIALSVNLSERAFEGGVLQIMEKAERRILARIANTGIGDAVLFWISPRLLHKVTDVVGDVPRVVLAGWFEREPQYAKLFPAAHATAAGRPRV